MPTVIFGAPSTIRPLAQAVQNSNVSRTPLKAIISTYEMLDEGTHQYIRKILNSEIFDLYSTTETNDIAWECQEHNGYHINKDYVVVELLKDGDPVSEGESGEIFVTDLQNYAMPLIRYKIGDICTFTNDFCSCGRKLPLLRSIEGREINFIVLPNGQTISPYEVVHIMSQPMISKFRIVQENKNLVVIRVVKGYGFNSDSEKEILKRFKMLLEEEMEIRIQYVDTIPREKSGKQFCVISKVHNPNF